MTHSERILHILSWLRLARDRADPHNKHLLALSMCERIHIYHTCWFMADFACGGVRECDGAAVGTAVALCSG